MKIIKTAGLLIGIIFLSGCGVKNNINQQQTLENNTKIDEVKQKLSECEKAEGIVSIIEECDRSKSEWCKISEKEQCYADQVKNGGCAVGKYDEDLGGVVGITPRVICDGVEGGQ